MEALSASVAVLLVYALTRSGNHSETEDSVAFAVRVRDDPAADLLEGTHAVYLLLGRGFARVLSGLGLTDDPLLALHALDMLLGATAVGGLWLLLRHAGATALAAAAGCGTVAFSYGFWRNAVDAEVYALSAVALVGCLAAAWAATQRPSARAFAVFGLANGVAVLAHVTNVLFAVAAGVALLLASRAVAATRPVLRWGAAYVAAAAAVVVPVYGVAAVAHDLGSASEFRGWFTERSGQAGDFGTIGFGNVARAAFGSARALVGGHFALALEPIRDFATGRFAGKTFSEELFFLEGFPRGLAVALLGLGALAGALVVALGAQWLRRPAVDSRRRRVLALLAAAWLVPYALLFLWWDPLNIEYWPAVWLPAAVLVALALDTLRSDRTRAALAVGAVASLFAVNLVGSVLPQREEERDLWRAKAEWYRAHARAGDLLVSNGYVWSAYLRYLVDVEVVDIEDLFREADTERAALEELRRRVASAPARVLVSGEAFHAFADRRTSCLDAARTCEIAAATARELRDECRLLAVAHDPPERVWTCPRTA